MYSSSPGPATTRLMKFTLDLLGSGSAQAGPPAPIRWGVGPPSLVSVARPGDDALDEVHARFVGVRLGAGGTACRDPVGDRPAFLVLGIGGRMEDDDLADVRVAEVQLQAVHEHALPDGQRRFHRAAR